MKYEIVRPKDTNAWVFQVWASFILAVSATGVGIANLPVDIWVKGFVGMGLTFSVGSSFTLSKTIRDNHEAQKMTAKIEEAKVEKLLSENYPIIK